MLIVYTIFAHSKGNFAYLDNEFGSGRGVNMNFAKCVNVLVPVLLMQLSLVGCSDSTANNDVIIDNQDSSGSETQLGIDPNLFVDGALIC